MKANGNISLVLSNSQLVPYCAIHVPKYHEWMKSEELLELTASEPLTIDQEYEMQKSWHLDEKKCTFIILDKNAAADDKDKVDEISTMVGDVNLFFNDMDDPHCAELEIMIAEKSARGKGIGKEAALAMMHYGITSLEVTTYTSKIGYTNTPSISLFNKLGFTEVSRSEAFQEVTLELKLTKHHKENIESSLGEYAIIDYCKL